MLRKRPSYGVLKGSPPLKKRRIDYTIPNGDKYKEKVIRSTIVDLSIEDDEDDMVELLGAENPQEEEAKIKDEPHSPKGDEEEPYYLSSSDEETPQLTSSPTEPDEMIGPESSMHNEGSNAQELNEYKSSDTEQLKSSQLTPSGKQSQIQFQAPSQATLPIEFNAFEDFDFDFNDKSDTFPSPPRSRYDNGNSDNENESDIGDGSILHGKLKSEILSDGLVNSEVGKAYDSEKNNMDSPMGGDEKKELDVNSSNDDGNEDDDGYSSDASVVFIEARALPPKVSVDVLEGLIDSQRYRRVLKMASEQFLMRMRRDTQEMQRVFREMG